MEQKSQGKGQLKDDKELLFQGYRKIIIFKIMKGVSVLHIGLCRFNYFINQRSKVLIVPFLDKKKINDAKIIQT